MDASYRQLVELLFATVVVEPENAVIEAGEEQLLEIGVNGDVTLLFRDRSLELLRELQQRLGRSALAAGGPTTATLEPLLVAACRHAVANGRAPGPGFSAPPRDDSGKSNFRTDVQSTTT